MDFDNTNSLMGSTLKKLTSMMGSGGSRHMCYLALFMLFVFFVLYFAIRHKSAS